MKEVGMCLKDDLSSVGATLRRDHVTMYKKAFVIVIDGVYYFKLEQKYMSSFGHQGLIKHCPVYKCKSLNKMRAVCEAVALLLTPFCHFDQFARTH